VERIETKRPADAEHLQRDYDLQDIITVNLERAVQYSVDVATHLIAQTSRRPPETMSECFSELRDMGVLDEALAVRLQNAVGFRNVAVNEYDDINWDIVFAIVTRNLDDFRAYARAVLRYCGIE
jgi:uncharacterized protein YutE (UPF0331/DUF86 family)